MKKFIILFVLISSACSSVPTSIKSASSLEMALQRKFNKNIDTVVSRALKAYKEESFNNIDFRASVALNSGGDKEDLREWIRDKKSIVQNTYLNFVRDYVRIKLDFDQSQKIHLKIHEYLTSEKDVENE